MKTDKRFAILLAALLLASAAGLFVSTGLGVINFAPARIAHVIMWKLNPSAIDEAAAPSAIELNMIWGLRIPRALLGFIVGASLAVCGVCMQTLVRNRLADPYILGVSSCAAATACACMLMGVTRLLGEFGLQITSFAGALLGSLLVYGFSRVRGETNIAHMLMAGVIISMIMAAVTSLMTVTAPDIYALRGMTFWLMGSLTGAKWEYLGIPLAVMLACLIYLMTQRRALNAIAFGGDAARTLGVDPRRAERALFIVSSLLTGICVSVSGSIGFVGMIVPYIARRFAGAEHKRVLPLCALLGGNLVVWADVLARLLAAPDEIPVGIMTALLGAPVFLLIFRWGRTDRM